MRQTWTLVKLVNGFEETSLGLDCTAMVFNGSQSQPITKWSIGTKPLFRSTAVHHVSFQICLWCLYIPNPTSPQKDVCTRGRRNSKRPPTLRVTPLFELEIGIIFGEPNIIFSWSQFENSGLMSCIGNRPVPTGVQAGCLIGAKSGWGSGGGGISVFVNTIFHTDPPSCILEFWYLYFWISWFCIYGVV